MQLTVLLALLLLSLSAEACLYEEREENNPNPALSCSELKMSNTTTANSEQSMFAFEPDTYVGLSEVNLKCAREYIRDKDISAIFVRELDSGNNVKVALKRGVHAEVNFQCDSTIGKWTVSPEEEPTRQIVVDMVKCATFITTDQLTEEDILDEIQMNPF